MKKFQNLGRELSRNEQKKITGGNVACIECGGSTGTLCAGSSNHTCSSTSSVITCTNNGTGTVSEYRCPPNE